MTEYVLADAIEQVKDEQREIFVRKLAEGKSWTRSIAENFIGSVVVALVWALVVVVIATNKVGPDRVIGDLMGKDIIDRASATPPSSK